jgi:hypothetical protein
MIFSPAETSEYHWSAITVFKMRLPDTLAGSVTKMEARVCEAAGPGAERFALGFVNYQKVADARPWRQ